METEPIHSTEPAPLFAGSSPVPPDHSSGAAGDTPSSPSDQVPAESPEAKKIAELEASLKERDNRYLYLYAEFENFKKRAFKERIEAQRFGWESVARDLLQVLDNLERALEHAGNDKNLKTGLDMVSSMFKAAISKGGVEAVNAVGLPFDPHLHEAVGQESSELPAGVVSRELEKGYNLHGRLLRAARVIISTGPAPAP